MAATIEEIEAALRATGGFQTYAARRLGITYNAVYARIQKSEHLQEVVREIRENTLDLTEHKLIQKIKDEDLGAICFYLKCQGKSRGYVERQEIEHSGEQKLTINIIDKFGDGDGNNDPS